MRREHLHTGNTEFRARRFWTWAFALYVLVEALYSIFYYLNVYTYSPGFLQPPAWYLSQWLLNILLTAGTWYGLLAWYNKRIVRLLLVNLLFFIAYYTICVTLKYFLIRFGAASLVGHVDPAELFDGVVFGSWFDIGKYVLCVSAFYVLRLYVAYRQAEMQKIKLAVINKEMQLNLLKEQLSPHFYFNTLNNLYGLARSNDRRLSEALRQLSTIMHYVIEECNQPKVSLGEEVRFLESFISLEKLRYEENTVIEMQVSGHLNGQMILPLLLIQFVENAFKHGMKEKSEQNWMRVNMNVSNNELIFAVSNSCHSLPLTEGIGITSVKRRLDLQYEGKFDMEMSQNENLFSVILKLNLS